MKKIIFILLGLSLIIIRPNLAYAQEATASGSPSPEQTTQELKERIQRIVEEKSEQIKGVIDQLSQAKRGFIGQVERVTSESITLSNSKGTEIIAIDDEVSILKNNRDISIDDIAVEDWLVVMGLIEDDAFVAKRVLVSTSTLRPKTHFVVLGTIIDQKSNEITVLSRKDNEVGFKINTRTEFQDQDGEIADEDDFIQDLQVIVVGTEDEDGKTATIVRSLVLLEAIQTNE